MASRRIAEACSAFQAITGIMTFNSSCPASHAMATVVSQPNFWVNYGKGRPDEARFTRLLLDRGADPNVRASLRARLEEGHGGGPLRDYPDVTPLSWGQRFPAQIFVSRESLRLVAESGGKP